MRNRIIMYVFFIMSIVFGSLFVLAAGVFGGGFGKLFGHELAFYGIADMGSHVLQGLLCVLLWMVVLISLAWFAGCSKRAAKNIYIDFFVVILLAFLARTFFLYIDVDVVQVNDNQLAWNRAIDAAIDDDYLLGIPRWMNFIFVLRVISYLFGTDTVVASMTGILFTSITSGLILLIAYKITGSIRQSVFAGLSYAFFPACIAYSIVCTPEHYAVVCFAFSVFFFICTVQCEKRAEEIFFVLLSGFFLGLGNSVKPLVFLFLLMYAVYAFDRYSYNRRHIKKLKGGVGFAKKIFCVLSVIFILQWVTSYFMTRFAEREFAVCLLGKQSSVHMLVVGLNRQGEGQIHLGGISRTVQNAIASGMNMGDANNAGVKALFDDWRGKISEVPEFVVKKTIWAWQDFNTPFRFVSVMRGDEFGLSSPGFPDCVPAFSQMLYLILLITMAAAFYIEAKDRGKSHSKFLLFGLLVAGYFMISMIIEGQSRYKSLIIPFMILWSMRIAEGGASLGENIKRMWLRRFDDD